MQLFLPFTLALVLKICTAQGNYDNTHNTTEEPQVVYYATDPRVQGLQDKDYSASTPSATPEVSPSVPPQQTDDEVVEELPDVVAVRIKRRLKRQSSNETQNYAEVMEKKIKFFHGNVLRMNNSFNSSQSAPNCSQQVLIYSPNVTILPRRLGSCINSKDWAKGSTVVPGILNYKTKTRFRLEHVTLNCSRINVSGYNFLWNASLKVSAAASTTDHDQTPFLLIIFMLRCENSSGSNFRKHAAYHVEKFEPSKNSRNGPPKPTTAGTAVTCTDMPCNYYTLTTPSPPPSMPAVDREDDHKNTLGMAIGIPIGITAVLGLVFGICYHSKRIMHGKDKRKVLLFRKKNNIVETTDSISI